MTNSTKRLVVALDSAIDQNCFKHVGDAGQEDWSWWEVPRRRLPDIATALTAAGFVYVEDVVTILYDEVQVSVAKTPLSSTVFLGQAINRIRALTQPTDGGNDEPT